MTTAVAKRTQLDIDKAVRLGFLSSSYRYAAQHFLDYLEEKGRGLDDPEGWAAYSASLRKPHGKRRYASATVNHRVAAARAILRFAWSLTEHTPEDARRLELALQVLKPEKVQRKAIQPVTKAEVRQMIAECHTPTWGERQDRVRPDLALMVEFAYLTGCRVSEMINILLTDIHPFSPEVVEIVLHGKGSKQRTTVAPAELVDRCRLHFRGKQYLFESPNHAGGDPRYSREHVSMMVNRLARRVCGRGFGLHNLRHSFATTYYEATRDLYGLQKLLGHSSVRTTAGTYVHGKVDYGAVLKAVSL